MLMMVVMFLLAMMPFAADDGEQTLLDLPMARLLPYHDRLVKLDPQWRIEMAFL